MPLQLKVTGLDYNTLREEFNNLASELLPEWKHDDANDPVVFLSEVYLQALDRLAWFANAIGQEHNIFTARELKSIYGHARRLGYRPNTRQPSTVLMELTVEPSDTIRTLDPFSVVVSTESTRDSTPVMLENLDTINIPENTNKVYATFVEGRSKLDTFVSSGAPYQRLSLSSTPVILETALPLSFKVLVDNEEWTYRQGLRDSSSTDNHFTLEIDYNGRATVMFGNNLHGKIPDAGKPIKISYRVGGGQQGNVLVNTVNNIVSAPSYITAVTNNEEGKDGTDAESISSIKTFAPLLTVSAGQLNNLKLIENWLESTSVIARAKAFLSFGEVTVQILTKSGATVDEVRSLLLDEVKSRLVMGYGFRFVEPNLKEVDVDVTVYALRNASSSDIEAKVRATIDEWLDPLAKDDNGNYIHDFGRDIIRSDLGLRLKQIDGIYDYEINKPTGNIEIADNEIVTNKHINTSVVVNVVGGRSSSSFISLSGRRDS